MIWLGILLGFVISIVSYFLTNVMIAIIKCKKYHDGEHHCNWCRETYVFNTEFKFCPLCGRKLTLHYHHPNFTYDEYGLERPTIHKIAEASHTQCLNEAQIYEDEQKLEDNE